MKRTFMLLVFLSLVLVSFVGTAQAARTIPASNETSTLIVEVTAYADTSLRARTDLVLCQGNEDLRDNPPLNSSGEGVNCIIHQEHTMATSGSTYYAKDIMVDTGNQIDPANNLKTTRHIDFSATSDGTPAGNMYSSESTTVTSTSTAYTGAGCCNWGIQDSATLSSTCDQVTAGSEVSLYEGEVTSDSSARIIAAFIEEPVEITYSVNVGPSAQTGEDHAKGSATAYVEADITEGSGDGTAESTDMGYDQSTTVRGLIDLVMEVSFSTGGS
ncbi:MAG TPA: hypothetical protein PLR27_04740 [Methanoregulaceae archaeon]|nr:MAG: hypothetical protein IPI71_06135 [Methanolinea sp.]HON81557.1 hypothetical protein [Methanoregulaceae archaeon]HRU30880.1 hypothetical protein [Methanoregulaceae archaeon]